MAARGDRRAGRSLLTTIASPAYVDDLLGTFAHAADRSASARHRLSIAGLEIDLIVAGTALALDALPLAPGHASRSDGQIVVWDDASTGTRLPPFPWTQSDIGPQGAIDGWNDANVRTVYHGDVTAPPLYAFNALSMFDASRRTALFWAASRECIPWFEHVEPLRPCLHWLLGMHERHLIHAAALGGSGGAVLIAGKGFAGKTTLAMACVQHGLGFLGDNYVVLSFAAGAPRVDRVFANIKLRRTSVPLVAEVDAAALIPHGDRLVFDVPPAQALTSEPVKAVLVLERSDETRLSSARAADALLALAPSSIYQLPVGNGSALGAMAELLRSVPAYTLAVGTPQSAAVAVADLLARL